MLGPDAPGLSATTIVRLKANWAEEYERWLRRDLSAKRYVYFWADGIYFSPRLEHDKQCLLVPPALETDAEKWLASVSPAKADDINPFAGALSLVVEPRLSNAARWYVIADPAEIDGLSRRRRRPLGREQIRLGRGRCRDPGDPRLRRQLHRPPRLVRQCGRLMADIAQLVRWRDALMAARYRGVRTVAYDGKRVTDASDAEMAGALADLERRIAECSKGRFSVVRIQSSKGV